MSLFLVFFFLLFLCVGFKYNFFFGWLVCEGKNDWFFVICCVCLVVTTVNFCACLVEFTFKFTLFYFIHFTISQSAWVLSLYLGPALFMIFKRGFSEYDCEK